MAEGGTVMSRTYWAERAYAEAREGREYINSRPDLQGNSSDTVLCLDISKSMEGDAFDSMIKTAKAFIYGIMSVAQRFNHEENVSIVTFGHETKIVSFPCKDYTNVIQALDALYADGPSPLEGGLVLSLASLNAKLYHNLQGYNIRPKIILMTDGVATPGVIISGEDNQYIESEQVKRRILTEIQAAVTLIERKQYTIYCIPFGVSDQTYLDILTGCTGGKTILAKEINRLVNMTSNCILATNVKHFHCIPGEDWKSIVKQQLDDTLSEKDFDYVVSKAKEATSDMTRPSPSYEEFDINMPPIGKRVRRGPDWIHENQDEMLDGTIIGQDAKGWLWVQWDHGGINIYPYNAAVGYSVVVVDETRQLPPGKNIDVGICVVRGPSWKNGNEDGGPGNIGVCFRIKNDMISVKWENGVIGQYRFGKDGCFDIEVSALSRLKNDQSDFTLEHGQLEPDPSKNCEFEPDAEPFTRSDFKKTFSENVPDDINDSQRMSNECYDFQETQMKTIVQTEESKVKTIYSGENTTTESSETDLKEEYVNNDNVFAWKYFKNETWNEFDSTTSKTLEKEYLLKRKTKVIELDDKRFRVTFCKTPMKIRNSTTSEEFIVKREEINIPQEVRAMKTEWADLYKKSLSKGKEKVYNIRVMVVGPEGVGKTVLTRRLLKLYVDISKRKSTNGIDVHIEKCGARISNGKWEFDKAELEKANQFESRIIHVMQQKPSPPKDEATIPKKDVATTETEITMGRVKLSERQNSKEMISTNIYDTDHGDLNKPDSLTNQNVNSLMSESMFKSREMLSSDITTPKEIEPEKQDEMLTSITEKFEKLYGSEEEVIGEISFWDFGGQIVFYSTHQTFLSPRAVYIVVIDISKALKGKVNRPCFTDKTGKTQWNYEDYLLFWLRSINAYCKGKGAFIPPIIIVATHLDKLKEEIRRTGVDDVEAALDDKVNIFRAELNKVLTEYYLIHLVTGFIAIDNTIEDEILEKLRMDIYNVSKTQKHWGEEKPASWILLEKKLFDQKKQNLKIISFEGFCKLNSDTEYPIRSTNELQLFLAFHHAVGNVLYFNEVGFNDNIILNPQWLIDAFKLIITSAEFVQLTDQDLLKQRTNLDKYGILHPSLIDGLLKQDQNNNLFHEHKSHIIRVMEKLDILAKPDVVEDFDSYFVPSMLKEVLSPDELSKITYNSFSTPYFCYVYEDNFLPPSFFHQLLAACMGRWTVSKRKTKYLLYCGCGIFNLTRNQSHRLLICSTGHLIQLKIYRYDKTDIPERRICEDTRRFIEQKSRDLMFRSELCLKSTPCIRCKNASFRTTDGMIEVQNLMEMSEIVCHDHDNQRPGHCVYSYNLLRCWYTDKSLRLQYDVDRVVAENYARTENYSFENYDRIPSEIELNRMAKKIGTKFQSLGRELGILDSDIKAIIADKPGDVLNQCFEVLKKWTEKNGENATLERLEKAMIEEEIDVSIIAASLDNE